MAQKTSSDMLNTIGFEKSKIGSGDKEVGYQIKETSLCSLMGSLLVCFSIMGLLVVMMVYDVRLEKKTLHRQVRTVEHHAARKLAEVQMSLWSQYRDDVAESKEADLLMKHMEKTYGRFQGKFQEAVNELAQELNLNQEKAGKFADRILHIVADMQQDNIQHSKHLLDHLVKAGKRGAALEKHVDKEILANVEAEKKKMDEGGKEASEDNDIDELNNILQGFFDTFNDHKSEFGEKVRSNFETGHKVYDQLVALQAKITGDNPPSDVELGEELSKIDLASVGAPLGEGRVLPLSDIVEELVLIPKIPHEEIKKLEQAWKKGKMDAVEIFTQLEEWHESGKVPSGWLQMGVEADEKKEEEEEAKLGQANKANKAR